VVESPLKQGLLNLEWLNLYLELFRSVTPPMGKVYQYVRHTLLSRGDISEEDLVEEPPHFRLQLPFDLARDVVQGWLLTNERSCPPFEYYDEYIKPHNLAAGCLLRWRDGSGCTTAVEKLMRREYKLRPEDVAVSGGLKAILPLASDSNVEGGIPTPKICMLWWNMPQWRKVLLAHPNDREYILRSFLRSIYSNRGNDYVNPAIADLETALETSPELQRVAISLAWSDVFGREIVQNILLPDPLGTPRWMTTEDIATMDAYLKRNWHHLTVTQNPLLARVMDVEAQRKAVFELMRTAPTSVELPGKYAHLFTDPVHLVDLTNALVRYGLMMGELIWAEWVEFFGFTGKKGIAAIAWEMQEEVRNPPLIARLITIANSY
jgi:hypothetical protein